MLLMANPYIYRLILADPLDSIQLCCLVLFVLVILSKQYRESSWSFIAIGIATGLNPSHGLIAIQGLIITKCNLKQKLLLYLSSVILSAMMLSFFIRSGLAYYYRQIYFPQVFTPQFNLTWILYSHVPTSISRCSNAIYFYINQLSLLYQSTRCTLSIISKSHQNCRLSLCSTSASFVIISAQNCALFSPCFYKF